MADYQSVIVPVLKELLKETNLMRNEICCKLRELINQGGIGGQTIIESGGESVEVTGSGSEEDPYIITVYGSAPPGGSTGQALIKDSNTDYDYSWQNVSGISGLTTNYITKATSATSIGNSQVYDDGTTVLLGTTISNPTYKLFSDATTQIAIGGVSGSNYAGYFANGSTATVPTLYVIKANTFSNIAEFYSPTQSVKLTSDGSIILSSLASTMVKVDGTGKIVAATTGTDFEPPLTFSTGLTRTTNTITVNNVQNIIRLSNLTTNGLVKTTTANGTLATATAGTDYQAPITLTTTGTTGAATLVSNTLNIPRYDNAAWSLLGNSGTSYTTNFLGTTNNVNLAFRVNNIKSGMIEGDATGHTAFGYNAMGGTLGAFNNTVFGYNAGRDMLNGENNTLIGSMSGRGITNATATTGIGFQALMNNTGNQNTGIGNQVMRTNTSGINCVAIGHQTLFSNQSGSYNSAIGILSCYSNTTGGYNVGVGEECLFSNSTGFYNTAIGSQSLYNTTGQYNVGIGHQSGYNSSTGENNTFIGVLSASNKTTGDNNTAIGYNSQLPSNTASNQLSIKNLIFGTGLTGTVGSPAGNIGIGDTAPTTRLSVSGTTKTTNIYTISGAPTVVWSTGVGVSSTPTAFAINGTNKGGIINFTPSVGALGNATVGVFTFSGFSYPNGCAVVLYPRNKASGEYFGNGTSLLVNTTTGSFTITSNDFPLGTDAYSFSYIVEGF